MTRVFWYMARAAWKCEPYFSKSYSPKVSQIHHRGTMHTSVQFHSNPSNRGISLWTKAMDLLTLTSQEPCHKWVVWLFLTCNMWVFLNWHLNLWKPFSVKKWQGTTCVCFGFFCSITTTKIAVCKLQMKELTLPRALPNWKVPRGT